MAIAEQEKIADPVADTEVSDEQGEDWVTPLICAAVYLDDRLRGTILRTFPEDRHRAWAPCYGVDHVALLRHSRFAQRLKLARNLMVTVVIVATAGVTVHGLLARHGMVGSLAGMAALLVLFLVFRVAARNRKAIRSGAVALVKAYIMGNRTGLTRRVVGALALTVAALVVVADRVQLADLRPAGVGVLLIWVIVVAELEFSRRRAVRLRRAAASIRELAPRLSSRIESRLERLADCNVVVHNSQRADLPFVGNGLRIHDWDIPVVVNRGKESDDGNRSEPEEVDLAKLHEFLETAFPAQASGWSGHRVYADGGAITESLLAAGGYGPPREVIERSRLLAEISRPENEPFQRTYFCVQKRVRGGEIIVDLFVRPHLQWPRLFLEIQMYAVLPLERRYRNEVVMVPPDRSGGLWWSIERGTRRLPRMLLTSPARCCQAAGEVVTLWRRRTILRRRVKRGRWVDFGAGFSVREYVAIFDPELLSQFELVDLTHATAAGQDELLGALRTFFDDHGIDTTEFETTRREIVKTVQNWNIGDIKAGMVGIGNEHQFFGKPAEPATEKK